MFICSEISETESKFWFEVGCGDYAIVESINSLGYPTVHVENVHGEELNDLEEIAEIISKNSITTEMRL